MSSCLCLRKKFCVDFMISVISFQLVPIRIKNDDKDDSFSIGLFCDRQVGTLWIQSVPWLFKKNTNSPLTKTAMAKTFTFIIRLTNGLLHGLSQKTMISEIREGWLLNSYSVLNCPPVISYQHITNTCNRIISLCTSPHVAPLSSSSPLCNFSAYCLFEDETLCFTYGGLCESFYTCKNTFGRQTPCYHFLFNYPATDAIRWLSNNCCTYWMIWLRRRLSSPITSIFYIPLYIPQKQQHYSFK